MGFVCRAVSMCLVLAAAARAGEPDPASSQIPADTQFCVAVRSLARLDWIARDLHPIFELYVPEAEAEVLAEHGLVKLLARHGVDLAVFDASRPLYVAFLSGFEPVLVGHPAKGVDLDGHALAGGFVCVRRGPAVVAGARAHVALAPRGKPLALPDADVVLHVFTSVMVKKHGASIAEFLADVFDSPERTAIITKEDAQRAVESIRSISYALRWRDGVFHSEGRVNVAAGSVLSRIGANFGEPWVSPVSRYLPTDASMVVDFALPDKKMLDAFPALRKLLSERGLPPFTGRSALAFKQPWIVGLIRVRAGTEKEAVIDFLAKAVGDGPKSKLDRDHLEHGAISVHRLDSESDVAFFAILKGYCVVSSDADADAALRRLRGVLDRFRKGGAVEHWHDTAVAKMGGPYHFAFSSGGTMSVLHIAQALIGIRAGVPEIPKPETSALVIRIDASGLVWRSHWQLRGLLDSLVAARKERRKDEAR